MVLSSKLRTLLIGKVWPEPSATAAGQRTLDVLQALQGAGHELHFATASAKPEQGLGLAERGISEHAVQVNDSTFDQWIAELNPDVVIFDRFMIEEQFGWRVERNCPSAMRVLDTSDLHCLRKAREDVVLKGRDLDLFNDIAVREIASIHRCDLSLMISEFEMELLRERFAIPESQVAYWPFFLDLPDAAPSFEAREHCILIGSFLHALNLDAARWTIAEVWPLVRKRLPKGELHLYGSYGEKYAVELHKPQLGILFKGRADNALRTMERYRLNLAPLRFGAGLKGKVFDGFRTGTPSIVTPIAVEGVLGDLKWGHQPSDDPQALVDAIVQHYKNEADWNALLLRSQQIASERFNLSDWPHRLPELIDQSLETLEQNRHQNFTGRLLRHHQHRSTEFMSRWIEAKQHLHD